MTDSERIAFCAGLFEGEGCFSASMRNHGYRRKGIDRWGNIHEDKPSGTCTPRRIPEFRIAISMTDQEPLKTFQATFGGNYYGPSWKKGSTKPVYALYITKRDLIKRAINAMWSYLSPRRREQAAEFYHWNAQMG